VKDSDVINDDILKKAGAKAVIRTGKNSVQVVIGTNVESVAQQMKNQM
jgi:PTS system N-acetylglucosamine-specific IIC component